MASRFMKIKKMIIPVMTAVIIASQLSGCAIMNRNDMLDLLSNGEEIVLELASPEYTINVQGQQAKLTRVQLDSLQTYIASGFRDDFDELFGVTPLEVNGKQISKQGCIYVNSIGYQDGNTSFMDSLRNKEFMDKFTSSESKTLLFRNTSNRKWLTGKTCNKNIMIWNTAGFNLGDISFRLLSKVCKICLLAIFIPFIGIDTMAASFFKCKSHATNTSK